MLGMDVEGVSWHPMCSLNTNNGEMVAQNLVVGIVHPKPMWKFCTIFAPQKNKKKPLLSSISWCSQLVKIEHNNLQTWKV